MREPIFKLVGGDVFGVCIAGARASRRHAPDIPIAGTVRVEVNPFTVGRIFPAVVVAALGSEPLFGASGLRYSEQLEFRIALADDSEPFSIGRPSMEIRGR